VDDFLTPTEKAETAFNNRVKALGLTQNDDVVVEAWQNSFSVECFHEYADDLQRWEVALSTLNMLTDR
jgi:hypothetical protein